MGTRLEFYLGIKKIIAILVFLMKDNNIEVTRPLALGTRQVRYDAHLAMWVIHWTYILKVNTR